MNDWIGDLIEGGGYFAIFILMFLENLFPPIPSELIMPAAGIAAAQDKLDIVGVILSGTAGTLAGALFWYHVAKHVGEEKLKRWADRHGRWLTLSGKDIAWIDKWFSRHGSYAVPAGHIIPTIRTLISLPAGLFGMALPKFIALTLAGGSVWSGLLALLGYWLGSEVAAVELYLGYVSNIVIALLVVTYLYRVATFKAR